MLKKAIHLLSQYGIFPAPVEPNKDNAPGGCLCGAKHEKGEKVCSKCGKNILADSGDITNMTMGMPLAENFLENKPNYARKAMKKQAEKWKVTLISDSSGFNQSYGTFESEPAARAHVLDSMDGSLIKEFDDGGSEWDATGGHVFIEKAFINTPKEKKCPKCGEVTWDVSGVDQALNKCWKCGWRWMDDLDDSSEQAFIEGASMNKQAEIDYQGEAEKSVRDTAKIPDMAYRGDVDLGGTWAITISKHRDSDALARSNYEVIKNDMESKFPEDVSDERFNHWAVGWMDHLLVRMLDDNGQVTEAGKAILDWNAALSDYPIADESHYSELESEEAMEYIEDEVTRFINRSEHVPDPEPKDLLDKILSWLGKEGIPEDYSDPRITEDQLEKALIASGYWVPGSDDVAGFVGALGELFSGKIQELGKGHWEVGAPINKVIPLVEELENEYGVSVDVRSSGSGTDIAIV